MTSEVLSTDEKPRPAAASSPRRVPLSRGLSTKLLLLTIVFVLLAEILIFLPWIASYRVN
ncbi:MAG: sensor histidine kinase, partial [Mesorhizobium sp.]